MEPDTEDRITVLEAQIGAMRRGEARRVLLLLILVATVTLAPNLGLAFDPALSVEHIEAESIHAEYLSVRALRVIDESGIARASLECGVLYDAPLLAEQEDEGVQFRMADKDGDTRVNLYVSDRGIQRFAVHDDAGDPSFGVVGNYLDRFDDPGRDGIVVPWVPRREDWCLVWPGDIGRSRVDL